MIPRFASKAEYFRHHRQVFTLALELGVTPVEAEKRMKAVEERETHRAKMARRGLQSDLPPLRLRGDEQPVRFDEFGAPWMMRD